MENLGLEELRDIYQSLKDVSKCAVCLHTLRPDTVLCVNGHAICEVCKGGQAICPTCRKGFSNVEKPTYVRQVLELIPHTCRYEGCTHIVKKEDNHEKYCSSRPVNCKACEWEGPVKELEGHWNLRHTSNYIGDNVLVTKRNFNVDGKFGPLYSLLGTGGHFLWNETEYNSNSGVLIDSFIPVLNGKPTNECVSIQLIFESNKKHYEFGIKVEVGSEDIDENKVYVPVAVLKHFVSKENRELKYKIHLSKCMS